MPNKEDKMTIGFASLAVQAEFDLEYAKKLKCRTQTYLQKQCGKQANFVIPENLILTKADLANAIKLYNSNGIDALLIQMATFPDGEIGIKLVETMNVPVIIWGVPEPHKEGTLPLNSFCGINLLSHPTNRLGVKYDYIFGEPGSNELDLKLKSTLSSLKAIKKMGNSVLGQIGGKAPGFYASDFDELLIRKSLGIETVFVSLQEIMETIKGIQQQAIDNLWNEKKFPTVGGSKLDSQAIEQIKRIYLGFKRLAEFKDLDALAVRDWPELLGEGWHKGEEKGIGRIWPALAYINDSGITVGYEGDVYTTLAMMILRQFSNDPPFFTDIIEQKLDENLLLLWHYGCPPTLAKRPKDVTFTESGYEFHFNLKEGEGMLVRLEEKEGRLRLLATEAQAISTKIPLHRASVYVKLEASVQEFIEEVISEGWGHHFCFAYGKLRSELEKFCRFCRDTELELTIID